MPGNGWQRGAGRGRGTVLLAERTHAEAARLARDRRSLVLLPLGAVEQHGPHLPLLVDWLGAEELARRIAPTSGEPAGVPCWRRPCRMG